VPRFLNSGSEVRKLSLVRVVNPPDKLSNFFAPLIKFLKKLLRDFENLLLRSTKGFPMLLISFRNHVCTYRSTEALRLKKVLIEPTSLSPRPRKPLVQFLLRKCRKKRNTAFWNRRTFLPQLERELVYERILDHFHVILLRKVPGKNTEKVTD
jgi:hypothetical protein